MSGVAATAQKSIFGSFTKAVASSSPVRKMSALKNKARTKVRHFFSDVGQSERLVKSISKEMQKTALKKQRLGPESLAAARELVIRQEKQATLANIMQTAKAAYPAPAQKSVFGNLKEKISSTTLGKKMGDFKAKVGNHLSEVGQSKRLVKSIDKAIRDTALREQQLAAKYLAAAEALAIRKKKQDALANIMKEAKAARKAALQEARVGSVVGGHKKTRKNKKRTKHNIRSRKQRK